LSLVLLSYLLHPVLSVESHSDSLVGLDELVELLGEVLVLQLQHPNVIVEGVDLGLQVRVLVE